VPFRFQLRRLLAFVVLLNRSQIHLLVFHRSQLGDHIGLVSPQQIRMEDLSLISSIRSELITEREVQGLTDFDSQLLVEHTRS
jgi:hypothetical protein